jgi:anti-sigma factor RsiW
MGWRRLGFHLRHIAGSVDRLTAYLEGRPLDAAQLAALAAEMEPGASLEELLADVDRALRRAEETIRAIDPPTFAEPRWVGRKRLPTTVIGLAGAHRGTYAAAPGTGDRRGAVGAGR